MLNSLIIYGVPCILSKILTFSLAVSRGYTTVRESFACFGWGIVISIAGFLLIYQVVPFGIFLTGKLLAAIAAAGVLLFYAEFLIGYVLQHYCEHFFSSFFQSPLLEKIMVYTSSLRMYQMAAGTAAYLDTYEWKIGPRAGYLAVMFFLVHGFTAWNLLLFLKRPMEAAEKTLSFEKTQPAIRVLLVVPLSLALGDLLQKAALDGKSMLLAVVGPAVRVCAPFLCLLLWV